MARFNRTRGFAMPNLARLLLLACLAGAALLLASAEASAWVCTAHSRTASGWGASPSLSQARFIALRECAIRTPRGRMCRISSCR
jgi:hypothetical protein